MQRINFFLSLIILFCCTVDATVPGTATIWGRHNFPYIPADTKFGFVAGGINTSYALTTNGNLFFWGEGHKLPSVAAGGTNTYVAVAGTDGGRTIGLQSNGRLVGIFDVSLPANLSNVVSISASQTHFMALRSDGTVWDESGSTPAVSGVRAISAGSNLSVVLFSNGTAQAWAPWGTSDGFPTDLDNVTAIAAGDEQVALLRDNGSVTVWGGEDAPAHLTNVVSIVSGRSHFLALKRDGTVEGWGWGEYGETEIPPGLSNVVQLASGANHSLALKSDGTIVSWGSNLYGQSVSPADMQNVVSVAAGWAFSILVREDGSVFAVGQMGDFEEEASVPGGLTNIVSVAAGYDHALVLKQDGRVTAWGKNLSGQCNVPLGLNNVKQIAAGESFSVALRHDGSVVTWGSLSATVPKPPNLTNVVAIAAGSDHVLALCQNGTVVAWGANWDNQCDIPEQVEDVVAIAAGGGTSVALIDGGTAEAWGSSEDIPKTTGIVGMDYGLFIRADGAVVSWGWDASETWIEPPHSLFWISGTSVGPDNRILIVSEPIAPSITKQPRGGIFPSGQMLTLDCVVQGPHPLNYQWKKEGANIIGATDRTLVLERINSEDVGKYHVFVTNGYGGALSSIAEIGIYHPEPLEIALGSSLFWATGGSADWFVQNEHSVDGLGVQSGSLGGERETWIETVIYGNGQLKFSWKLAGNEGLSRMELSVNGFTTPYFEAPEWATAETYLGDEKNVVRWRLINIPPGRSTAWLDNITFTPDFPANQFRLTSALTNEGLIFQAHPQIEDEEEPLSVRGYVVQSSTNLIDWLSVTNFSSDETLIIPASPAGEKTLFYRAITP